MVLFFLLLVPLGLGFVGLFFSNGRITLKEFGVHEGLMVVLIASAYFLALCNKSSDTEVWNGVVAEKARGTGSCCHDYPCNPHPCSCDSDGNNCSTCYDTCYEHISDRTWYAVSSNGETVYHQGCGRPGASDPDRWEAIVIGEPTAVEHSYTNYIKGNPDSIMRRQGAAERFKGRLPSYPEVYDHYRIRRFLGVGVTIPGQASLNERLSEINGRLGARKKVNIVVVVVNEGDQRYLEALRETWYGGKINDFVVVIGAPDFPAIAWVGVLSWTRNEDLKVQVRDEIVALHGFDGPKILDIIEEGVGAKFEHRPISDFDYLKSTIEPSGTVIWTIGIIGVLLALGLQIYFWFSDPFGDGHASYRWTRRIRFR